MKPIKTSPPFLFVYHKALEEYEDLVKSIAREASSCRWRIIASHVPLMCTGPYQNDEEVRTLYHYYQPLMKEHKIHAYISGHEHMSEYLKDDSMPNSVFLVAGATGWRRRSVPLSADPRLMWADGWSFPTVLRIDATSAVLFAQWVAPVPWWFWVLKDPINYLDCRYQHRHFYSHRPNNAPVVELVDGDTSPRRAIGLFEWLAGGDIKLRDLLRKPMREPLLELTESQEYPETFSFVTFGDWGFPSDNCKELDLIRDYLGHLESANELDAVFLLGYNFYPNGVTHVDDPLFDLFSDHLSAKTTERVPYYVLMGNHDPFGSFNAQFNYEHAKWKTRSSNFLRKWHGQSKSGQQYTTCVWFLHYHLAIPNSAQVEAALSLLHIPIVSVGDYRTDEAVLDMYQFYQPVVQKYRVNAFISGHEHSNQWLVDPAMPDTVCLIAGLTGWDRQSDPYIDKKDPKLKWTNAVAFPSVLRLNVNYDVITFEFVDLSEPSGPKTLKAGAIHKSAEMDEYKALLADAPLYNEGMELTEELMSST